MNVGNVVADAANAVKAGGLVPVDKLFDLFKMIKGTAMPRLRVVVLTSPPWGVYPDEDHDTAVDKESKAVGTITFFASHHFFCGTHTTKHTHTKHTHIPGGGPLPAVHVQVQH
jgi:hypothetical protein